MTTTGTEQQVYADDNVLISTTRLIVNGTTYPLSNVSSVRLLRNEPNYVPSIILFIIGLCMFAGGSDMYVWAVLCLALGGVFVFLLKPEFTMLIGSAGGEKAAMRSNHQAYMADVVEHINNAIIARG